MVLNIHRSPVPHAWEVIPKHACMGNVAMTTLPQDVALNGCDHRLPAPERMHALARKRRDTYAITPGAPLIQCEFGFYCLEEWKQQGMPADVSLATLFHYDGLTQHSLHGLGWCEAAFVPEYEVKVLEDRGEYELVQDFAGRHVLCFKGRRNGFMPEYVDHPVKDMKTWQESCKWRLRTDTPQRWKDFDCRMTEARSAAQQGFMIVQHLAGAGMYLRSLIGPEGWLYAFYDMPEVVHDCMRTWLELADAVTARHQQHVTFDEIFFAEDICYNHGALISPEVMKEFFFPYYQQLLANVRRRQLDPARKLHVQIDTDGDCRPVIDLYIEQIGMDSMSPFEVASGCDVVEIGLQYPQLVMRGGIDKRVLAAGPEAIDAMVERIVPVLKARGGYIPCCDHGVPAEVKYQDYLHYRRRMVELGR